EANEFSKKLLEDEEKKKENRRRCSERFSGKYWVKMPVFLTSKKDARADKLPYKSEDKENKRAIREEWLPKKKPVLDINDTIPLVNSVGKNLTLDHHNNYQHSVHLFYVIRFFLELYQLLNLKDSNIVSMPNWSNILNSKIFKLIFNNIRHFKEQKSWLELKIGLECLNQMSKTLDTVGSKSTNEDHESRNKAQQLQHRILNDKKNLELIVDVVKSSSKQPVSFLRSLVETVHRLLSTLERVKSRKYIYVKQKRRANKHSKNIKYIKDEYEYRVDKIDSCEQRYRAKAFEKYEMCFVNEEVLSTYCALLDKEYETIDLDFHYINTMFYRIFSYCESSIFLKLSFMELLNRVLEHFKELTDSFHLNLNKSQIKFKEFANKIVEDFAERMEKNPLSYIELIFSKTDLFSLKNGHESYNQALLPEKLEHLEFKKQEELPFELKVEQWIENLLSLLIEEDKLHLIRWLQDVLRQFAEENRVIEDGENNVTINILDNFEDRFVIMAENAEQWDALANDEYFTALLKMFKFVKIVDEDGIRWIVSDSLSSADLFNLVDKIDTKIKIIDIRKQQEISKEENEINYRKRKRDEEE
ncbi:4141_t:CDS:10, partial [Scutellospora calospora]